MDYIYQEEDSWVGCSAAPTLDCSFAPTVGPEPRRSFFGSGRAHRHAAAVRTASERFAGYSVYPRSALGIDSKMVTDAPSYTRRYLSDPLSDWRSAAQQLVGMYT